jgi:hypothetical protein
MAVSIFPQKKKCNVLSGFCQKTPEQNAMRPLVDPSQPQNKGSKPWLLSA